MASTLTYTGYLVVGVLADQLGTGRVVAGLLLGVLFARFPWFSKGKFRTYGLLPPPFRRPVMAILLALCLLSFVVRGAYFQAVVIGVAAAFLLAFPWLRRALWARLISSVFQPAVAPQRQGSTDAMIIDAEFKEKKE